MMEDGWREAMCGTISFFNKSGDRMHTIYTASSPEYGKDKFLKKLEKEINNTIELFPKTPIIGLADGALSNWLFLTNHCDILTIDFWHVTEYLAKAANVMFSKKSEKQERESWLEEVCHNLKHKSGAASRILKELKQYLADIKLSSANKETLQTVITYFNNQKKKMQYSKNIKANMPIGSGVTESACKSLVKQRMCKGSARWKEEGASVVLTIRSIHMTKLRWDQFWSKHTQYGYEVAA
jgi:hypothetical protein